jgi:hypothetical protein
VRLRQQRRTVDGERFIRPADVRAQLFGQRERGQTGAAQLDQESGRIVVIGLRQRKEVVVIHRDLDAARSVFDAQARDEHHSASQQTNQKDKRGKTRSRVETVHVRRIRVKKQEGPPEASPHCRRVCGCPHTGCGRRF